MFRKSDRDKPPDVLAHRLKAIAAKPALDQTEYEDLAIRNDRTGRAKRDPTFKQATLRLSTGERIDVVVKNVSDTGARVEFFKKSTLSEKVLITEPTLRLRTWARVTWQVEGAAGLQFLPE
ncbi:MAG: hypothetical protein SGJ21_04040 [Alphaproteobacteria bacterium]|nr:hypothetical protein [Alphaproteobacteria bacterium]